MQYSKKISILLQQGNLNNHIGVLTILSLKENTEIGIVEMGANQPGEIALLASIAQPDAGLITNFGEGTFTGIWQFARGCQSQIGALRLPKSSSIIIFANADDSKIMAQLKKHHPITYGTTTSAQFFAKIDDKNDIIALEIDRVRIQTQLSGVYNAYNTLAAYAIGKRLGFQRKKPKCS